MDLTFSRVWAPSRTECQVEDKISLQPQGILGLQLCSGSFYWVEAGITLPHPMVMISLVHQEGVSSVILGSRNRPGLGQDLAVENLLLLELQFLPLVKGDHHSLTVWEGRMI